ncbi:MAG: polysaccharide biosynthesis/export family protein, partial [Cyanobacteria bacterium P01_D01_bin.56]
MMPVDANKPIKHPRFRYTGAVRRLLLGTVCCYLWQSAAALAQSDTPVPIPASGETEILVEPDIPTVSPESSQRESVPTVETPSINLRPTVDDLDSRILERSSMEVNDPGFNDNEFDHYRLGPGDGIFISVQRFPDLAFQATLDQQGNIIVPIEGAIPMAGLTLNEAENRIRAV